MLDIIAVGMPVMDLLVQLDHLPTFNQGARTIDVSWQYGGKVATAMVAVARLGRSGGVVGPYGGLTGKLIKRDFDRHGLDTSRMIESEDGADSPLVLALADESTGGRSFMGLSRGMRLSMPESLRLDKDYITSAKYLLISSGDPASAAAARWCRDAGIPVVIDADGYTDKIHELLPLIDHFLLSEFYYEHLYGTDKDYEKNLRELRALQQNDSAVTVVTLGENGLAGIDSAGKYFVLPAYKVTVADTTGAGDVFHGAYIVGLLEGMTVKDACQFASAVSAIKCTRLGGRAAIPTMGVVKRYMATGEIDYTEIEERVAYYRKMPFES